jgi:hypothetical protein
MNLALTHANALEKLIIVDIAPSNPDGHTSLLVPSFISYIDVMLDIEGRKLKNRKEVDLVLSTVEEVCFLLFSSIPICNS